MPAVIVLGDRTDHGGTVIEASGVTDTHGRQIARVGDKVSCPKKGHGGTSVIATGDLTFIVDGKAVAYHGCKTACGATLISSQAVTALSFGGTGGGSAAAAAPSSAIVAAVAAGAPAQPGAVQPLDPAAASATEVYDDQFELRDEEGLLLADIPYTVKLPTGELSHGQTDESGRTRRYVTDGPQRLEVFLGHI